MKRKNLLFLLLLALALPWAANAQNRTVVTIGEGTSTQRYPLPGYYGYQYDVYIYTPTAAPALDADCDISSIAFNVTTNNTDGESTMEIWVKDVDANYALATATTFDDYTAGAELVYENNDFTSTTGWNTLAFTRDFSHQGGKALLVAMRGVGCGTSACSRQCTYTSVSNTTWYKHQDNSDPGTNVTGYVGSSRANIQLDITYTGAVCLSPSGLAASNVTDNSATLSWNENGSATAWVLQYGTDSEFGTYTEENVHTTPSFGLTGLTALTTYYARVKPDCDTDGSHWNTATFTTTAYAEPVDDGWSDNFEGASCGWELINGTLTNKWTWGTAANNGGTHGLYISNDNGTSNAYSHSATMVYATKLLNFTEGKYEFSYDWKANGESSWDFLRVVLVPASVTLTAGTSLPSGLTSTAVPSGWIALDGGSQLQGVTSWQSKSLAINVTAGNYYLVMAWKNDGSGGTQPPAAVDNVSITRMACPYDVTDLAVDASSITTSGATITWTAGEAEEWQVATKAGTGEWTILPNTYTTNSATLTGLTAATNYQVRVRAYCNANDQGAWCDAITFTTECEAIDLSLQDYSENFDSYTASTGFLPVCWNRINEGTSYNTYPYIYGYNAHSTSNSLYFYTYGTSGSDQYAILPEMENMEGKQITLWAKGYNADNTFKIGMMTDPTDATTFEEIAEQTLTTSYEEYSFILGRGNYVAIMMETPTSSTTKGVYIDDITIADVPACMKPSDLTFVSATTTSATIGWTIGGNENAWQIAYSTDPAFDPDEVTPVDVTSNPGTIDGLTAATTYYAYVRANCGNNGYSDWSSAYCMFTTECEAITNLPWSENFDAYTGSTGTTAPAGYPNDQLPTCWQFLNRSENSSTYPQVFISSNSGYPVSGNCLFFKSSSTTPLYAILPEFSEDIANLQLTFTYRNEGESAYNGTLIVGYMTDPTDATTFTSKHTCEQTQTLTEVDVLFTDAPAGSYIAFKYEGGSSNNYYLSIDNVSVNYPPTCSKPTDLVFVSATTTEATLSWTNGAATQTAWQIAYSTDPAFDPNEVTPVDVTSNPGTISGLTAATTYYAYVRANCGNDDYSDWSSAYVQFDTECDVIVVDATHPFTEGFDGITSGIPVCWDNSEGTTSDASYRWNYYATGYKGHCVRFNSYNNSADNTNFLKTPVMNLPQEGENLQLSFWYKNPAGGDFSVYISTDGGDTYTTALASDLTDQSEWTKKDISLREYAGNENVVIVFAGTSNWGYNDAYIYLDEVFVGMPFTKPITGYGTSSGGYYLIASPVVEEITPSADNGFITDAYDLYYFNQAGDNEGNEWINYKAGAFNIESGKGYLYASQEDTQLIFSGTPYSGDGVFPLVYNDGDNTTMKGWNLVGNPFAEKATIGDRPFYTMNDTGLEIVSATVGDEINAMEGIFVKATATGETVTFSTAPETKSATLALNLSQGRGVIDRAIVRFDEGLTLPKFQINRNSTKLYILQDNEELAVVSSTAQGEMPVSFKAAENGRYTLSVNTENVEANYLHLVDNMTGADIDLLSTPSYSFDANTTDYANRFKLVFATGNASVDNFAFFSNGNFVINNEGEATLQVVDVTGRILSSEQISGSCSKSLNVPAGVYMLRLVNGENVKVQKVVVR